MIKYIRKHCLLGSSIAIEYTIADCLTVEDLPIEFMAKEDQQLHLNNKQLTSFRGLVNMSNTKLFMSMDLDNNYLISPYRDTYDVRSPFIKMTNLQTLNLETNLLERLPATFFDGLNNSPVLT